MLPFPKILYVPKGGYPFHGTDGDDIIYGNETSDDIDGGDGNDWITGKGGTDVLKGSNGNDVLIGGSAQDYLSGGDNEDILFGHDNADYLKGNDGNDYLSGGAGQDILNGDKGNDQLWGGSGRDVFLFTKESGYDIIRDFEANTDQIQVETPHATSLDFILSHISYADGNAIVQLTDTSNVTLLGITAGTLTADDFMVYDVPA